MVEVFVLQGVLSTYLSRLLSGECKEEFAQPVLMNRPRKLIDCNWYSFC